MDAITMRFNIIAMLLQNRDYSTRTVEELETDANKLVNYAIYGGQPVGKLDS